LSNEEADRVGGQLCSPGVDGDFVVRPLVGLHLDGQQQQLQFDKTKSEK